MLRFKPLYGGALLTALFIMTLVAIVATAMSMKLQSDIYRTHLVISHDKLYLASEAVTFWAFSELKDKKAELNKRNSKGFVAVFPSKYQAIDEHVRLNGELYDLQARFNLNNTSESKSLVLLSNILNKTITKGNNQEKSDIIFAVQDWISPYDLAKGSDSYTAYYLDQKPPYYPSHQFLTHISELRLIKGVSAQNYLALEPWVTVLPEVTPININTAPKALLKSLGNGLSDSQLEELVLTRKEKVIENTSEINEILNKMGVNPMQVTSESSYFLCVARAETNDLKLTVMTVLKRQEDKNKKMTVSILGQSMQS